MATQRPPSTPAPFLAGGERLTRDLLTGLPSEHFFRLQLPVEFARARERERNGAFLAVKLDGIAQINERHGRSGGDEALQAVAYILSSLRSRGGRETHAVFRLTGSMFGYFIPECSAPEARTAAEEIHEQVQQSQLFLQRLTVSIGLVNFYEFFLEDGTEEQLARRIERVALYRLAIAARRGANTICDTSDTASALVSSRPTVLIVDPDPGSLELLVRTLEAAELVVKVCADGESALEAVQASPPAVIVCEAMSPRLNGFAIRERLQTNALWNAIPFILVSHRKNDELIRKAVERDIRHFFRKPVSLAEVAGLVENLIKAGAR
jgi:diguanylate cyclase (GGDEF)-like protein